MPYFMSPSSRFHILFGLTFACLGVIIGAFAAHGLKPLLSLKEFNNFETAVKYQFYHAFALLVLGLLGAHFPKGDKSFKLAGFLFFIGKYSFLRSNNSHWRSAFNTWLGIIYLWRFEITLRNQ
jgi:uncharacterized membrane protein YgdD (TMEM256/DUF423 family)